MKRKAAYWDDAVRDMVVTPETIHVIDGSDERPVDTGLLDASGNPILRPRHTIPFGFQPVPKVSKRRRG